MSGRAIAIGVGVALAGAGAAYGFGRYQGVREVREVEARASASASAASNASVMTEIERGKVARLEARRRLHLAIIALEDKNFGIAQDHVNAARGHLASAKGSDNELQKLTGELEAYKVPAAEDISEPRKKLLEWCKRLDNAMPP